MKNKEASGVALGLVRFQGDAGDGDWEPGNTVLTEWCGGGAEGRKPMLSQQPAWQGGSKGAGDRLGPDQRVWNTLQNSCCSARLEGDQLSPR